MHIIIIVLLPVLLELAAKLDINTSNFEFYSKKLSFWVNGVLIKQLNSC